MAFPLCFIIGEVPAIVVFTNGKTLELCQFWGPKVLIFL